MVRAVKGGHVVGAEEVPARPPRAAIAPLAGVHSALELEGVVEGNFDLCLWREEGALVHALTLLLADRLQLLTQLASEDELAAHQRGDVQAARLDHVVHRSEEHTSELQSLMRISYA